LIPVCSKVTRALATAKFSRALAALYAAGVGPGESVRLAAGASGNEVIARSTVGIIPRLEQGERMTAALESTGHFPVMVLQMLRVGEDSGALDEQLDKAADFLETDAETAIKQATVMIGILALLAVAAYIGMIVIQFWTGYFNDIFSATESG
jgi:type II secretory pathway component PulF